MTAPSIRYHRGVQSISRPSTGDIIINFIDNFVDTNYVITGCVGESDVNDEDSYFNAGDNNDKHVSSCRVRARWIDGGDHTTGRNIDSLYVRITGTKA